MSSSCPSDEQTDLALAMDAGGGSREAFDELVVRYRRRVYNLARGLCRDDRDVEDLVQDTFVRAYRGIRGFRGQSSFWSWLYRIAVNVILAHLSRRGRLAGIAAASAEMPDEQTAAANEDWERHVIHRLVVERAIRSLPPDLRLLLVLREIEGLGYEEIAEVLGIPRGTVDSRLFRARRKLRLQLEAILETASREENACAASLTPRRSD